MTRARRVPRPILVALAWLIALGLTAADAAPVVDAARADPDRATPLTGPPQMDAFAGSPSGDLASVRGGPGPRTRRREPHGLASSSPQRSDSAPTVAGIASTYGPGWDGWIAWPSGPGWRLRVCGPGGCIVVVTTDAGPDLAMQRAGRVVDLDVATFELVAGTDWTVGLTRVTVTVLGRARQAVARQ